VRLRRLRKIIPISIRPFFRKAYALFYFVNDRLTSRNKMIPWSAYGNFIGGGDFERVGRRYLERFQRLGALQPSEDVLDVGCGIGRMAIPLTSYLTSGRYEGFDVMEHAVGWCEKRIGSQFPNFHFTHVDIYNKHYNPRGRLRASNFDFPYADDSFDFVFLISVFTHMLPEDVRNYMLETRRVLRAGGRAFITYTLLNQATAARMEQGLSKRAYPHDFGVFCAAEKDEPETAVAYDEGWIRGLYAEAGLEVVEPIHYGRWSGLEDGDAWQDIAIARRPQAATG
jgi:SAM-dependent methyltransferase